MFSQFGIQVDTTNFTEEDVQAFCRILEEIHEKREQCEKRKANIQQYPSKAVMTHHEIFDSIGSSTKNNNFTQKLMKSYQKVSPLNNKNGTRPSKLRQQLIGHVDLLLSPKSSPSSKRKINYTSKSVDFDINDEKFHQLSVKEKAMWYEKTKTHQLQSRFQGNHYSENNSTAKKHYVKHLRDLWEARLNRYGPSLSLKRQKKLNKPVHSKLSKENKKSAICEGLVLNNWREELKLKYLTSEDFPVYVRSEAQGLQGDRLIENLSTTYAENTTQSREYSGKPRNIISNESRSHLIKPSEVRVDLCEKRQRNILQSAFITNEFMAPPRKIRRLDSQRPFIKNTHAKYMSYSSLNQRSCVQCHIDEKLHNKAKGNTTFGTLLLDELDSKFKNTVVLDDVWDRKSEEKRHFNSSKFKSSAVNSTKSVNDMRTMSFDTNSSAEYPESNSSGEACSMNSGESIMEAVARKKRICRCLNGKDKNDGDYIEVKLNWSSDSEAEPNIIRTVTLPFELNRDTQNNICASVKHHDHIPIFDKIPNGFTISDKSLQFDLCSPKKVIPVYTLTTTSTLTSAKSCMDTDHDEYPKPLENPFISKDSSVILDEQRSAVDGDIYIDQGFETGSNDTQSPIRNQQANYSIEDQLKHSAICSTPNRNDIRCLQHNLPNRVSPIKVNHMNNEKHRISESPENLLANSASEFWVTFGNYTISLKIHHCPWERLLLLRKAFVQHQIKENIEINFGIDKQIFPLHSKSILLIKELIQRLPKKNYTNYSFYWFCKGNVLLPFKGPVITTAKIRGIFTCLQGFRDQNDGNGKCCECLTFGIDNYVFFTSHNSKSHSTNSSKLSDLGYSGV